MKNRSLNTPVIFVIVCCLLILMHACKKKDKTSEETVPEQELPVLLTGNAENISQTKVLLNSSVSNEGSSAVTARGICWSQQSNPTLSDKKTSNGSGGGGFASQLKALAANTKYYARAYATNSYGTSYGNEVSFTTSADADGTVTDADGNTYHVLKIGNQYWLKENLRTTTYRNGDSIKYWSDAKVGGYCYLGDAALNDTIYGAMYNWFAFSDSRGITPPGWHVPSAAEWQTLIDFAGGPDLAAVKLKEKGTRHWNAPNNGSDDYGFAARGGAYRVAGGQFFNVGYVTGFWTTENYGGLDGAGVYISGAIDTQPVPKPCAIYIRCIKD